MQNLRKVSKASMKQKTEHQSELNSVTPWTLNPWKASLHTAMLRKVAYYFSPLAGSKPVCTNLQNEQVSNSTVPDSLTYPPGNIIHCSPKQTEIPPKKLKSINNELQSNTDSRGGVER
jgi:hypothetical protein